MKEDGHAEAGTWIIAMPSRTAVLCLEMLAGREGEGSFLVTNTSQNVNDDTPSGHMPT